jgi:hypothetical protein
MDELSRSAELKSHVFVPALFARIGLASPDKPKVRLAVTAGLQS